MELELVEITFRPTFWTASKENFRNRNALDDSASRLPKFRCGEISMGSRNQDICTGINPTRLFPNRTRPTISAARDQEEVLD
ncbi:MAG: hypothetical protein A2X66_04585 [Ignavibacteria bacterium GWA2_54_16]|nr:MAG: hypothetical protein A2X66_04585 [Ignavibacteria bacterium GWA2_54_16]